MKTKLKVLGKKIKHAANVIVGKIRGLFNKEFRQQQKAVKDLRKAFNLLAPPGFLDTSFTTNFG